MLLASALVLAQHPSRGEAGIFEVQKWPEPLPTPFMLTAPPTPSIDTGISAPTPVPTMSSSGESQGSQISQGGSQGGYQGSQDWYRGSQGSQEVSRDEYPWSKMGSSGSEGRTPVPAPSMIVDESKNTVTPPPWNFAGTTTPPGGIGASSATDGGGDDYAPPLASDGLISSSPGRERPGGVVDEYQPDGGPLNETGIITSSQDIGAGGSGEGERGGGGGGGAAAGSSSPVELTELCDKDGNSADYSEYLR